MSEVIVITSGKGGVGKTTTVANLGTALSFENKKTVVVDADIGLRNLDVVMGLENRIVYDIVDVVIMNDEPSRIAKAIAISKKTSRIVWQNIIFALGVKVIVLVATAFGASNMWEAVFADVGVALIAVLNAMRAMRMKEEN